MQCNRQIGDELRQKNRNGFCESAEIATDDFVHFVVHFAARARGRQCEMCMDERPIRYC